MTDHTGANQGGLPGMARETKVGLLAGLAFIICFAIILANRGREDSMVPARSVLSDGGGQLPAALQQLGSRSREPVTNPIRQEAPRPIGLNPSTIDVPAVTPGGSTGVAATPFSPIGSSPPSGAAAPSTADTAQRTLASLLQESTPPAAAVFQPLTTSSAPRIDSVVDSISSSPSGKAAPGGRPYTVVPGDTLSKIALAHLGNKSRSTVDAIFEANRSVLQNPNDLRTGLVLTLPALEGKGAASPVDPPATVLASVPTQPPRRAEEGSSPTKKTAVKPAAGFRWYQVKKNDRYVSIAKEQLGDGGRWRELHEINKDKFPDPQMIREGVRIKLPAAKGIAAAEERPAQGGRAGR